MPIIITGMEAETRTEGAVLVFVPYGIPMNVHKTREE